MAYRGTSDVEIEPRIMPMCAYAGCGHASLRIKRPTGWANLCQGHFQMLTQAEANDFVKGRALTNTEQKIAFCHAGIKRIGSPRTNPIKHWEAVLTNQSLPEYSHQCAREGLSALHERGRTRDRQPGEDDE